MSFLFLLQGISRPAARALVSAVFSAVLVACGGGAGDPTPHTDPSDGGAQQSDDTGDSSPGEAATGADGATAAPVDGAAGDPTTTVPSGCISPAPSFAHDVLPILELRCSSCHSDDAGQWPLTSYDDVVDWEALVFGDLKNGSMPPADGGTLPNDERFTILDWIACGMPQ